MIFETEVLDKVRSTGKYIFEDENENKYIILMLDNQGRAILSIPKENIHVD